MTNANATHSNMNRKLARRQRAAERLQKATKPFFTQFDSRAQQVLENKLSEFLGLCRRGAISYANIKNAAENILDPVKDVMGKDNHRYWRAHFIEEGTQACVNVRASADL